MDVGVAFRYHQTQMYSDVVIGIGESHVPFGN